MIIRSVEFAGSVASADTPPPDALPQVAFSGRSNVGKSSLINTLLRRSRQKIARVSSTPGKTQLVNFFRVNDRFHLVDLPGFGYAKVPVKTRETWTALIEGFLERSAHLRGVIHLVDSRHPPTRLDHTMMEYLSRIEVPALVVLTKVDKLKQSERRRSIDRAQKDLQLESEQILPFSSKTGEGRQELLDAIDGLLGDDGGPEPGA